MTTRWNSSASTRRRSALDGRTATRPATLDPPEEPEPVFAQAVAEVRLNPSIGVDERRQYIREAEAALLPTALPLRLVPLEPGYGDGR
jgi:hypothetical protein